MTIIIDNNLKAKLKSVHLGCVFYTTQVIKHNAELLEHIDNATIPNIKSKLNLDNLAKEQNINDNREAYKLLGKEPSRYRVSSEALIRRILQNKPLYHINNVVDTNNLISIETEYSCGSYDLSKLGNSLVFRML